ncbi:putative ankyrin repeat family protein [Botrytis fragariae]|uniref:Putative ankyrin repeat family protein n=1 Tax=Botrytis fragariae TaxID=1964551 RepID=A0A8H6EPJ6_9HELO|nr:putative ankyrin repeat family protein [Botrytis fragariae]KAF5879495.1 putative ankyrin repeat family protein [Botrytis fragariae]
MTDSSIAVPRKRKSDAEIDTSTDLSAPVTGLAVTNTVAKKSKIVEDVNVLVSDELIATSGSEVDVDHNYHQPTVSDAGESNVGMTEETSEDEFDGNDDGVEDEYSYENEDEDSEVRQHGVEERGITIQKDGTDKVVKLRLFVTKDQEVADWLHMIHVHCTVDGKRIGHAFGQYICREEIRENFWSDMEAPSRELSLIAFELFDRYGYLNSHLKNHCVQKGTGVWGNELDFGSLFILEHIDVTEREYRRKGLGRAMIGDLVKKAEGLHKPSHSSTTEDNMLEDMFWFGRNKERERRAKIHTISMPGCLRHDVEPQCEGKSKLEQREISSRAFDSAISFHRSLGFRRIGASSCFGLSSDPDHKSHSLAIQDDFDPPKPPSTPAEEPEAIIITMPGEEESFRTSAYQKELEEKRLKKLKERLTPLNFAAVSLPDIELVKFFKTFHVKDEKEWKQVDSLNNTLLHITACQFKPQSVQWLMDNVNDKQLTSARNIDGYTPIEALQYKLNVIRTRREHGMMTVVISDNFSGFTSDATSCQFVLLTGSMPTNLSDTQLLLQLKCGCTCGECIGGFLSPRMKLALLFQAETHYDSLNDSIHMSLGDDGVDWLWLQEGLIEHVHPGLQQNFKTNKSLRQGFANMFNYIATCLKANKPPTRKNVLKVWEEAREWPPATSNYLQWGGTLENKVEAVLEKVFEYAHAQNEIFGDGEFMNCMEEEIEQLKICRNDHEYGFVAKSCGLPERDTNPAGRLEGMFQRMFSGMQ